jgi:hydroxymethylpyrimidine/phosphomethylpyrimidine kinase
MCIRDSVKTGALGSAENAAVVATWLGDEGMPLLVCDPVLESSSGGGLVTDGAEAFDALARIATAVTPNAVEAIRLAGADAELGCDGLLGAGTTAAKKLAERWGTTVIVTGLSGATALDAVDLIVTADGDAEQVAHPLVPGVGDVRGTGCMLASALACALADGHPPKDALAVAHAVVHDLVGRANVVGRGRLQVDLAMLVG